MSDLLKHFRKKQLELGTETIYQAQCPYCSVQCTKEVMEERIIARKKIKVKPNKEDPTSEGRLCIKGMNAHQHVINGERIKFPLLNVDGEFQRIPWSLALDYIKEKFEKIQHQKGNDAISVYGGGSLTNEEAYLLGKFARVALKTKYIDYNGRFCMSSAASAAQQVFGIDRGLTNQLSEVPEAKCIILAGTNIAECQPTILPYFRKAKKNGAYIIAIDPRETGTTKLADLHLKVKPGMDANLVNGILKILIDRDFVDYKFVNERTNGFSQLRDHVSVIQLDEVSEVTGVDIDDMITAAEQYGQAETGMVFTARGVEQHASGVQTVKNFLNLPLVTGKIGKRGCGYGAITGQGNGQGGREHGQKADQLPGYRSIENDEHRRYIAGVWGIDEEELPRKGVSAYELFEKIDQNEINAMFIMGSNPVVSNPNSQFVEQALKKLDCLVVADLYMSETARMADLILPTTAYLEDEGTMTNLEGRVLLRKGERPAPPEAKHDWQILCDVAKKLGREEFFAFTSAKEIFNELRIASRGGKADYYGVTYDRLREEGVFWPCPTLEHPGTRRLFESSFAHEDEKAIISAVEFQEPKEKVSKSFPLVLTTGRVMHHYLTGVQTRNSPDLLGRATEPLLEIHPKTAELYQIEDHSLIQLTSRRGTMIARSKYSETIREDTLFTTFHWGDLQSVNRLTNPALDPVCRMPEFKVSVVKVTPL
ncbi:assimilatory nitrate reductase catalytic subunit NasC [Desertibacillus haloalkaliphilus]|uniref:assimilatory nitrate reductase catalytic subunit NasC n=1 Tax=Desertibacillus haloalkaliphilus TaxID=1328930 RepID=UPI001C25255B|nr:nitrate reductase [Desertibacillus haloalkaliphilus]MBU8907801.1 nitrate reductase [Desertibacillus haloalkaliphilus]